ncbi:MAG: transporter, partial [Verrucomicrobiales bacterium]|nr:transporter [Verrucomicrobiales bacterium]
PEPTSAEPISAEPISAETASTQTASTETPSADPPAVVPQPPRTHAPSRDPLHGVTLEQVLRHLIDIHGWDYLADRVPVRCFMFDPTLSSSLKFLRKTPWARKKVEDLYRFSVTC